MSEGSYFADHFNVFIHKRDNSKHNLQNYDYEIMLAPTTGMVAPPISVDEIKRLVDFLNAILENNI